MKVFYLSFNGKLYVVNITSLLTKVYVYKEVRKATFQVTVDIGGDDILNFNFELDYGYVQFLQIKGGGTCEDLFKEGREFENVSSERKLRKCLTDMGSLFDSQENIEKSTLFSIIVELLLLSNTGLGRHYDLTDEEFNTIDSSSFFLKSDEIVFSGTEHQWCITRNLFSYDPYLC